MTHEREMERVLDTWLSDGPTEVPDRVFDVVIDRIEHQSQRPAWRLLRRDVPVAAYLKPIAAIAAVVIVAVVGYAFLRLDGTGIGAPTPRPSPLPTASATPASPSAGPISLSDQRWDALDAGTYVHDRAIRAVTFEAPDGWWLTVDVPWSFGIRPEAYTVDEGVRTWYDMRATLNDAECTEAPDPAIGHTAHELIAAFATRPGIVATEPQPISIGGLDGLWTDLHLAPDWTATCPFDPSLGPSVTLFTDASLATSENTPFWGVSNTEHMRVIALDDKAGSSVLIVITAAGASTFDALLAESMPVVESFDFDVAP